MVSPAKRRHSASEMGLRCPQKHHSRTFEIRALPLDIAFLIVKQLTPEAQVCFALTCRQVRDLVTSTLAKPLGDICFSTRKCACKGHGWAYLLNDSHYHFEFFGLMLRLRDWMPADQTFCYFCHRYMKHSRCSMVHFATAQRHRQKLLENGDCIACDC